MTEEIYQTLAKALDTLPNGFPSTESGVEIKLLKRIFRPEDAELFCDLRLDFETAQQISERTGRKREGLEEHLLEMRERGQIFAIDLGEIKMFKMVPWAFGIYEFQRPHMDRELAEMCEEFGEVYGKQFFNKKPQLMQVIPVEKEIPNKQEALSFEQVSNIIENSQSFAVFDCVCKKEKRLLDDGCKKPLEICTGYAPIPGVFDNSDRYRAISKSDAYEILKKAEEAALVHLTWNVESGHFFICNCCGCCCGVLRSINELGINASDVINSYYFAEIDPDECTACGTCMDERCQVNAIEERGDAYEVVREKCIGCGLCVTTCPSEAISLLRKHPEEISPPPKNEMDWYEKRAMERGIDFSKYK
ncbi:MAG: 4Fe-4S binding protein [Deltaproteobacteria bacterium]|nr:4Fe-4S binding protein [Deltaproteobacteria bacterium]